MTEVRRDWHLEFGVDDVLRSQAADPAVVRARRHRVVELAADALDEGRNLIEPAVLTRKLLVTDVRHNRLVLEDGRRFTGPLVVEHLGGARYVVVMLCTIGSRLLDRAVHASESHVARGFALDAVGSAAVHALSAAACNEVEADAVHRGLETSLPLSPGLEGWPVDPGQREIFSLIDPEEIGVEITASLQMVPLKSVTVVLGVGSGVAAKGRICDYCSLRDTCRQKAA